jgi:putative transposase
MRWQGYSEIEELLNGDDAERPQRREHHLPREEYRRTDVPFFLTLCARHHREPFHCKTLAGAVVEAIEHRRKQNVWQVYAYCLMPDHLHLVVQLTAGEGASLPRQDILTVLAQFKSFTTRSAWKAGLDGQLWQHDQWDRLLRHEREFHQRCQYVLDNPVRKGLVEDWTLWPYSGVLDEW